MPPKRKASRNVGPMKKASKVNKDREEPSTDDGHTAETELLKELRHNKNSLLINKPQFTCKECNKKFKFKRSYEAHLGNEHSQLPTSVPCPEHNCSVRCPDKEALSDHIAKVHDREIFKCPTCSKEFVRHAHVLRHMAQTGCDGAGIVTFPCEICKAEFTRKDNLMVHLRLQHIERKAHQCKRCTYSTRSFSKYVLHMQTQHTEGKPVFECDHCGKSTSSRAAMTKHLEIHGEKKYACDVCKYSTYTIEVIRRHVLTHVDDKPYRCALCPASFIQSAQLRRHALRHQHSCDVCSKGFESAAKLAVHMTEHEPADESSKQLGCPIASCSQDFKDKKDMKKHVKKDHDERPYVCEVCNKRYRAEIDMRRHVQSHTLERPRRCMYCVTARAYVRGLALVRHVRKAHPNLFKDHLQHVRSVLGTTTVSDRVSKSEMESILNVLDAEADRILGGYGEGVLYGGMQEVHEEEPADGKLLNVKSEESPLMSEGELADSVSKLLCQLIDQDTLHGFGWPQETVDVVLEKVVEQCGAKPADREKWTRVQRLRENAKHLFVHVVEDKTVARMLETHTIDQIVKYILAKVSEHDQEDCIGDDGDDWSPEGDNGSVDEDNDTIIDSLDVKTNCNDGFMVL